MNWKKSGGSCGGADTEKLSAEHAAANGTAGKSSTITSRRNKSAATSRLYPADPRPLGGGGFGDVAGKGVSASLLMARLSAAARFCLASEPNDVPAAVAQLNGMLTGPEIADRFVTFVVGVVDVEKSSLTLVNAGHLPPLMRRAADGSVECLGEDAADVLPLAGIDRPYEQNEYFLSQRRRGAAVHRRRHRGEERQG